MPTERPWEASPHGVKVRLRVKPGARADRIDGIAKNADGDAVLKASVTAPPEGGKANAAVIKMLAKAWRLPKSAITVTAGATGRNKTLAIDADDALERLEQWMGERA